MNAAVGLSVELEYFTEGEFERGGRNWYRAMDPRLLVLLDSFRHQWGAPVRISPAGGSLGRELSPSATSDHNITRHGRVLAADVMPEGMEVRAEAERAIDLARAIGFTSIGLYPHWRPSPGLHLGTRRETRPGAPALWGALRSDGVQTYVSLDQALRREAWEGKSWA